jgi:two-component system, NarL family, nitrate/nitrite response regulator NarL
VLDANSPKVRILLVDDHTIFRQGLVKLLNNQLGLELRLHCSAVGEGLLLLTVAKPDLVLLDVDLGNERGIDFLAQARRNGFQGPVLILTAGVSGDEEAELQTHGISGILRKDVSVEVLAARIRRAAETYLNGDLDNAAAMARDEVTDDARPKPLTVREIEVLRLLLEGHANKQIAHDLRCTESAVKGIIQQLFHKSGTATRSQLVRAALEQYRHQI